MAKFKGFSSEGLAFFKALGFHQDREWFHENKSLYESAVREPMIELLASLSERFEKEGIPLRGDKKSMFRINRDIRFSKDKRPYQTHTGAVMTPSGAKNDPGLVYIHITADDIESMAGITGSFVAAGFHMPDPAVLAAMRNEIRRDPADWLETEKSLKKAKLELETGSQLTRVPRGFEDMKASDVEPAIRLKSFIVEELVPEATVTSARLEDTIVKFAKRSMPLLEFGWKALGSAPR